MKPRIMRCLRRAFAVWLLMAACETLLGTLRTLFLAPVVGDLVSRQMGVAMGSLMIVVIAAATSGWVGAQGTRALAAVGLLWLALMLGFEVGLGRAFGLSWQRIVADYLPWRGGYMVGGMAVLALSPFIAAGLSGGRARGRAGDAGG